MPEDKVEVLVLTEPVKDFLKRTLPPGASLALIPQAVAGEENDDYEFYFIAIDPRRNL